MKNYSLVHVPKTRATVLDVKVLGGSIKDIFEISSYRDLEFGKAAWPYYLLLSGNVSVHSRLQNTG